MTLKGGASQACAACKYQRRRCISECPLAPYFPPDQPKMFQNAHKLFGVSNILKVLKNLDASQKAEAMRSIIYQAHIRERSPVHGCLGVIQQLQYLIWVAEEELRAVIAQLDVYRHQVPSLFDDDVPSQLDLGMAPPNNNNNNALSLFNNHTHNTVHSYSNSSSLGGYTSVYMDSKDNVNSLWVQHPYTSVVNNNGNSKSNPIAIQSHQPAVSSQPLALQQEIMQDYDQINPFFDAVDDRQSYIDSKEPYESSSEESLKDTTQSVEHVGENDLKSAAACFSLTTVN